MNKKNDFELPLKENDGFRFLNTMKSTLIQNNNNNNNNNSNNKNINLSETIISVPSENNIKAEPMNFRLNAKTSSTIIKKPTIDKNLAKNIIKSYLELDNIFIIRLISKNTNEIITHELIYLLLEYYQNKNQSLTGNRNSFNSFSNKNNHDSSNNCTNPVKKSINL